MAKDIGTAFQDDVQYELEMLKSKGKLTYVRLYDTKSARKSFLPAQPGDFVVAAGRAHLVECKASQKYRSLADDGAVKELVEPHQGGAARVWKKTGNQSWFLFYGMPAGTVEVWGGEYVGLARAGRTYLDTPFAESSRATLPELLKDLFLKEHQ